MLYEMNEQIINNLIIFLDRAGTKNLKELQAMNEILSILSKPVNNSNENKL